jgi:hypothetical protein
VLPQLKNSGYTKKPSKHIALSTTVTCNLLKVIKVYIENTVVDIYRGVVRNKKGGNGYKCS